MRLSNLHTTGVKKKKKKKYFLFYSINHYSIEYFPITSLVKSKSLHTWTLERAREEELKVPPWPILMRANHGRSVTMQNDLPLKKEDISPFPSVGLRKSLEKKMAPGHNHDFFAFKFFSSTITTHP